MGDCPIVIFLRNLSFVSITDTNNFIEKLIIEKLIILTALNFCVLKLILADLLLWHWCVNINRTTILLNHQYEMQAEISLGHFYQHSIKNVKNRIYLASSFNYYIVKLRKHSSSYELLLLLMEFKH